MKKRIWILVLALALLLSMTACKSGDYDKATDLYKNGDYEDAKAMFLELEDYEDSAEMVKACDYGMALDCLNREEFTEAKERFADLGDYKDSADMRNACDYGLANARMESGDFAEAKTLFAALGDYEDSAQKLEDCNYQELSGTWKFDFNYKSLMNAAFAEITGDDSITLDEDIIITLLFTFNEDRTYSVSVDEDDFAAAVKTMVNAIAEPMLEAVYQEAEAEGYTREEVDEMIYDQFGMTFEEYYELQLESYNFSDTFSSFAELLPENESFLCKDGKLYMTEDGEEEPEAVLYEVEGDILRLTPEEMPELDDSPVSLEDLGITFPIELQRVE